MTFRELLELEIKYAYEEKCELEDKLYSAENHLHELQMMLDELDEGK